MSETDGSPDISGHWISVAPEPMGELWDTREFRIGEGRWHVLFRTFADREASVPLFTLDVGGVYVVGGPSTSVAGAHAGIFPATHRHLICDSEAGAALFARMGAIIAAGERRALIDGGFAFVPPLMEAMGEYDLVALRDGKLFFGDRGGDLTKARPTALTPFPLERAQSL